MRRVAAYGLTIAVTVVGSCAVRGAAPRDDAERRAVAFLAREVPAWSRDNHCFSCHNNGDAARALLAAKGRPYGPSADALVDTLGWLERPERWDTTAVDPAISDKTLARLQFATALASAVEQGRIGNRKLLVQAAELVANDQSPDGSWPIGARGSLGTPATYGRPLATALGRQALASAGANRFAAPIARAERWLREQPLENVLDASAVLIGLSPDRPGDHSVRRRGFELLKRAQTDRGGWGPFVRSPPEPFDTALALLAMSRWEDHTEVASLLRRGRAYLVASQNEDGSWTETTRPAGGESYAQRISTSGWATLALLATENP
ncbi:MAG: hypothetical protein P4L84_26140 [Isosphaeraceae bacterium]|nr:hypothetical protein [Isosphaeraceae bacterium]